MAYLEARVSWPEGPPGKKWRLLKGDELKDPRLTRNAKWRAQIRIKGHPVQTATFDKKTDAEHWIARTEAAIREGHRFPERVARRRTVGDLIDRYVADVLPHKKSARTQAQQLAWWRAEIGVKTLDAVTPDVITAARDALARDSRRSHATVNRYLAALSHVFTVASKEWRWTSSNPVALVAKRKEPRGRVRYLDDDERERLLDACADGPGYLKPVVLIALATGMRRGEILGLRWRDVDLGGERGHLVLHDTKNGERRGVPLVGPALDALRAWGKVRPLDSGALVFEGTTSIHHAFGRALKRAGLDDFRFHDLRHTAASYLAMNGATPSEIAGVLGHKTLSMVKRYAHLSDAHLGDVLERMNNRFLADGGGA